MYHIVELMSAQLVGEPLLRREVEFDEVYALVLQIAARTGGAHRRPYLHVAAQCLFHYETAYEATGSCY